MSRDLKSMTIYQLGELIEQFGEKKYIAKYIFNFIHLKNAENISDITPLSKVFRGKLAGDGYFISSIKIVEKFTDPDGTVKYLFEMSDGERIESVLLTDDKRKTLCISTQIGCQMRCVFCATGKIKFGRNLTAGEIVSQVYSVEKDADKINNVVYMGMGEPFLNYEAVMDSLRILNHQQGRNIGIRHLTVSTCGLPEEILNFADEDIQPRLAISLHAADDATRNMLMPINKNFPLGELTQALKGYQLKTKNRITFEYILIKDINDTARHSRSLIKLLKGVKCNVNLIEYNPHPGCEYKPSGKNATQRFAKDLEIAGVETAIRFKRGAKINAACGQLGADWLT